MKNAVLFMVPFVVCLPIGAKLGNVLFDKLVMTKYEYVNVYPYGVRLVKKHYADEDNKIETQNIDPLDLANWQES